MPIVFDDDISGAGDSDLTGGIRVAYLVLHLANLGNTVRDAGDGVADHILHAGYLSLGNHFHPTGGTAQDWWMQPIWIDWVDFQWQPSPSTDASNSPLTFIAGRVRWWLSPGTDGHLWVFAL